MHLPKIEHLENGVWVEYTHAPVFKVTSRVEATLPHDGYEVFLHLAACLSDPYYLLYILHTPRGEGLAGRYQSPALDDGQLKQFFATFGDFLLSDARFDLWLHSAPENATLVWDRHNLLYAYGPLERIADVLKNNGYKPGQPEVSVPHSHRYRSEFDEDAKRLLKHFIWVYSPLQPEDEQ